jgi:hypothetical protein
MNFIVLLGAGFSRNWGGMLSTDVFDYLLPAVQDHGDLRNILWKHRKQGGFEAALAEVQQTYAHGPSPHHKAQLDILQDAIGRMFAIMDSAFASMPTMEFQQHIEYLLRTFLVRFDAIFSLNQDLLIERHYLNDNVMLGSSGRWNGYQIPGIQRPPRGFTDIGTEKWTPRASSEFRIEERLQPFIKVHGSSNWINAQGGQLMVMGGGKAALIGQHPILEWNLATLREYLLRPNTRLMAIGYGFADDHINNLIGEGVDRGTLKIYIVDTVGLDSLDKNRAATIYAPDAYFARLQPHIIGVSKRVLRETFNNDRVEHAKLMEFFKV